MIRLCTYNLEEKFTWEKRFKESLLLGNKMANIAGGIHLLGRCSNDQIDHSLNQAIHNEGDP